VRGIGELVATILKFLVIRYVPVALAVHVAALQGLRNMLSRLAPLASQRALLQQVADLQADNIGNEVMNLQHPGVLWTLNAVPEPNSLACRRGMWVPGLSALESVGTARIREHMQCLGLKIYHDVRNNWIWFVGRWRCCRRWRVWWRCWTKWTPPACSCAAR